jgi:hypothetical protein
LAQTDVAGVPLMVTLSFTNLLNQVVTVQVPLAVFAMDLTNPRDFTVASSTSPLKDVAVT